jgi:GDP-L-fucose synthase
MHKANSFAQVSRRRLDEFAATALRPAAVIDLDAPILVTGSGGLLGHAVRKALARAGFTAVLAPRRAELDLLDTAATADYFVCHRPEYVIHLASVVFGLVGNMKNQSLSLEQNTALNNSIFAAMRRSPVRRCFYAGTVASYPFPYPSLPLREEVFFEGLPHYGEFGYALAKRHAHSYLQILSKEIGLEYSYGVFTNLFGEHDRFDALNGHVVPSLIAKAYEAATGGKPFEVWGDGRAERDFLHADDAADAILLCLHQPGVRLVNISSGTTTSIREVAETIGRAAGIAAPGFLPDAPVGILRRVVDNSALRDLGFRRQVSIGEGLTRTYRWYEEHQSEIRR